MSLLDCLPKIQEILTDMQTLESLKAGGREADRRDFHEMLVSKVNQYLEEIRQQKRVWASSSPSDASLIEEYEEQLEGILQMLGRSEQEDPQMGQSRQHSPHHPSHFHRGDGSIRLGASASYSKRTLSSKSGSYLSGSERGGKREKEEQGKVERKGKREKLSEEFQRTGAFDYEEGSETATNRTTVEHKLQFHPLQNQQRFTFKKMSSENRGGESGYLGETLGRERRAEGGERAKYCEKFNEAQVKLAQEKIRRKEDMLRTRHSRDQWKFRMMKGRLMKRTSRCRTRSTRKSRIC